MEAYNPGFIVAAYTAMWIVILGYHWRLARRSARARADYDGLARGGERRP